MKGRKGNAPSGVRGRNVWRGLVGLVGPWGHSADDEAIGAAHAW